MNRTLVAVATLVLSATLAGCGGDSKDSAASSPSSSTPTSAIKDTYQDIDELRAAVREAGIQCPDSIWQPETASEAGIGEGKCGDDLILVVTENDEVKNSKAIFDVAGKNATNALEHAGEYGYVSPHIVKGSTWVASANPAAAKILVDKLSGTDKTEEWESSETPTP